MFSDGKPLMNRAVLSVLLLMFVVSAQVSAEEGDRPNANKNYAGHPHCGLYCLYSIIKLEGREIDFRDLVKPEYLGSRKGSSFEELKKAAEEFHLNAVSLSRLTPSDLKSLTEPAILHVKSSPVQKEYDHFLLYLGNRNGKAVIFDPPAEKAFVEFSSLVPKWDGNALVVSSTSLATNQITAFSRIRLMIYGGIAAAGICIVHLFRRFGFPHLTRRTRLYLTAGQAAGFAVTAVLMGFLCHYFYDGGFFANSSAIEGVQQAYAGSFIPKITRGKMESMVSRNNTIVLDTRLKRDYDAGHIENAVSLPVNCSHEEYTQIVSTLPKDKRIILYCQSAGCKFAETIALRLKEDGLEDLAIFKGGWVEWQELQESQTLKAEGSKNGKEKIS